ncbi:MAG: hypothetical protein HQL63_04480 [Magnetococcales bacterium]|nr:hypothetical protein [Magnetococcales bacterium]
MGDHFQAFQGHGALFNSQIIEQISTLWGQIEESQLPGSRISPVHVQCILERVFLAGLKREEDRPVQVSVSFVDPLGFGEAGWSGESVVFELADPLPFTVDSIVKLAAAFDPITTALAVNPIADKEEPLHIWGGVFASIRGRNRFDALSEGFTPPDLLTVSTWKPGSLSVFRGRRIIARFNSGRFTRPTSAPFTASLMGWSLLKVVKNHPEFRRLGVTYWRTYRDLVDRLLVESRNRGHGGTIIWVPEDRLESAQNLILPSTTIARIPEGVPLVADLCDMELQRQEESAQRKAGNQIADSRVVEETILECKRRIVEHIELLAQMTRVDGALILTDRLRVKSFGSLLVAPRWLRKTVHGPEEENGLAVNVNLSHYGTRHNSAVNFIGHCPGCVAFVLSQDGPIAGLTLKDDETVYWWPDCLSQLWAI